MSNSNRSSGAVGTSAQRTIGLLHAGARARLDGDGSSNRSFNDEAFGLALTWVRVGGSEDDYVDAVSAHHLGQTYPGNDLDRQLRKKFGDAEKKILENPLAGLSLGDRLRAVKARLEAEVRQAGLRRSAVELVEIGIERNVWTIDASVRVLAERTGFSSMTASRHMSQFVDLGFVAEVRDNGPLKARTYVVDTDYGEDYYSLSVTHNVPRTNVYQKESSSALWSRYGLGPTAEGIYRVIGETPVTRYRISKESGSVYKTVDAHLAKLVEHGLVVEVEGRHKKYIRNPDADTARVVEDLSIGEKREERQEQYELDRLAYHGKGEITWIKEHFLGPEGNPPTTAPFSIDRRLWRLNEAGLRSIEEAETDSALKFSPYNPPEEYREYLPDEQQPYLEPLPKGCDPFAAISTEELVPPQAGPRDSAPVAPRADDGTTQYDEPPF